MSNLAERAISEVIALLAEVRFDTVRGDYVQGDLSAVSVMVESEVETGFCRIRVMCHDPSHLGIEWRCILPILLERPSGQLLRVGYMDPRGRAEFRHVPAAANSGFGLLFVQIDEPAVARADVPLSVWGGHAAPANTPPQTIEPNVSPDGSLKVQFEVDAQQDILEVTIEATDLVRFPELRNGEVFVVLRSKSKPSDIWIQDKVRLDSNGKGTWNWSLNQRADFTLLVFPVQT